MTKIEEVIESEKHPLYGWLKDEYGLNLNGIFIKF